jgi:hypothetical protein
MVDADAIRRLITILDGPGWLKPLHEALLNTVLSHPKLFADEMPLPVLDPGQGKTKTCRLWWSP